MNIEKFINKYIGNSYQKQFDNMIDLNIYENKNDNLFFCSYIFNNNIISYNDLKLFKNQLINKNCLKYILDIIKTIDILEIEYNKNKQIIERLNKLLKFYLLDNN